MCLQMGGVDHQLIRLAAFCRQFGKYPVKYAETALADEAGVDRLVGTILLGHFAPPQTVPDHEDDAADDPPIVDPRHTVRRKKIQLNLLYLNLLQLDQITHCERPTSLAAASPRQ